jgi:Zn-dependent protease
VNRLQQGSFHLFRVFGIDVFLHWTWFAVALFEINTRREQYSSLVWNAAEYLALFAIVLMHEFGHALACRQVGGQANRIVLWPLGGVAFVAPPQRPGAMLWSIAAGPLVNVVLLPVAIVALMASSWLDWPDRFLNLHSFLRALVFINVGLLIFNLLPIYPLDGGQILRSLLWFVFGRARSLMLATIIGAVGAIAIVALAIASQSIWFGIMAAFMFLSCWRGWREARVLWRVEKTPRRAEFACPVCKERPPIGPFWMCHLCRTPFDTFQTSAVCPHCHAHFGVTRCPFCGNARPMPDWLRLPAAPPIP